MDLSHSTSQSSPELHFCRPMESTETLGWDTGTCASSVVFTDKGELSPTETSLYPPRVDVVPRAGVDSASVAMYASLNPFDAVSQATPVGGTATTISWPTPATVAAGNYVMWVEVSQENDDNGTYNATSYPAPMNISYAMYGEPYRGQPSVVYAVPFAVGTTEDIERGSACTSVTAIPKRQDGMVRPPDDTITTDTPASGASRFQLVADPNGMYRLLVDSAAINDTTPPAMPADGQITAASDTQSATVSFVAPGNDGEVGIAAGYDIRVRANDAMSRRQLRHFDAGRRDRHARRGRPGAVIPDHRAVAVDAILGRYSRVRRKPQRERDRDHPVRHRGSPIGRGRCVLHRDGGVRQQARQ